MFAFGLFYCPPFSPRLAQKSLFALWPARHNLLRSHLFL